MNMQQMQQMHQAGFQGMLIPVQAMDLGGYGPSPGNRQDLRWGLARTGIPDPEINMHINYNMTAVQPVDNGMAAIAVAPSR